MRIRSDMVVAVLWLMLAGAGPGHSADPVGLIRDAAGTPGRAGSMFREQAPAPSRAGGEPADESHPGMLVLAAALVGIGGFVMYRGWRMDRTHRRPEDLD